ncbi:sigma-70 family RNA polymerase sigma factor [Chitinophaga sp. SYP-B3965]|uniref:sigma-70 family RNA polymerase sigma factor n=1 Tax=Chitinophaga sp. SYP-B3965 TaxID=2663120 RepID=UPI001299A958|nr:sigma-70 family RNA polymerase sigma factor [Chitinophaga sp. SYP-B3965]MRG44680.1 sigma-70 family RNA polymerase sigma factor [Chitinophaga sp. SYP-B3965]
MESLRPLLTTYAYNVTGSLEEAKDIVQDTYLQFMQVDGEKIENKKAYLVRMVINLAINRKKKQQKMLSAYHGEWLPEPVATEHADAMVNRKDILSYSLMVLLDKLDPKQRAVFILKEAFEYDHAEIADVLGITVEYSRKILSRAKQQLATLATVKDSSIPADYLNKYLTVMAAGDTKRLEQLLNQDIVLTSDGGGKATAVLNPVHGLKNGMSMLFGLYNKFFRMAKIEQGIINHQPALFIYEGDRLATCQVFTFKNGLVDRVYFIRNPDKLQSLQKK